MDDFSALLLALYSAAREAPLTEFQDAALRLLQPVVPFSFAAWASGRMLPDGLVQRSVHLFGEPLDTFMDHDQANRQDSAALAAGNNVGHAPASQAPNGYGNRAHSGMRQDDLRRSHQNYIRVSRTADETGLQQWIGVYRIDTDARYTERERHSMELFLPHFIEALRVNRLIQLHQYAEPSAEVNAVIDRFGALHHADDRFLELIRHEWPLFTGAQLPQLMTDLLRQRTGNRYIGCAIVVCTRQVRDLALLSAREKMPVDDLTPRQLEVARHVADGLNYKEIARRLGLSPITVRNYIQAIHERLGVRTNIELSAQLNTVSSCPAEP